MDLFLQQNWTSTKATYVFLLILTPVAPFALFASILSFDLWILYYFVPLEILLRFNLITVSFFFYTYHLLACFRGAEVECLAQNICGRKIPRSSEGE